MTTGDRFDLSGRVAVVTGGAGLYGQPMCHALSEAGAHVVVASRDGERCAAVAAEIMSAGGAATGMVLDQSSEASVERFREEFEGRFDRLDILVNGAIHRQGGDMSGTSWTDWAATSATNSLGLFAITKTCAELMVRQGSGSIINIGSIYGVVGPDFKIYGDTGMTNPAFYAYDKGGMISFTRYLACLYGPSGVRVNCISPGGLYTDQPEEFVNNYNSRTPLGRMATVDDIKGAVVFLAADASSFVTGINLLVDGGWTAH